MEHADARQRLHGALPHRAALQRRAAAPARGRQAHPAVCQHARRQEMCIRDRSTPVVPLHDVALFGLQSLSVLYTDDELDKLLQAGVTPVQLRCV